MDKKISFFASKLLIIRSKLKGKFLQYKFKYFRKSKNPISSRITSYPYISGDTFLSIADCLIINNEDKPLITKSERNQNIIFIELDMFSKKWVFNYAKNFKKVILHNGDQCPSIKLIKELKKRKIHVFAANINFQDKYIYPIPQGIENAHHKKNGDLEYYNAISLSKNFEPKKNILLASFSVREYKLHPSSTEVRKKYVKLLEKFNYKNDFFPNLKDYRKKLYASYFVICPPGNNGFDCHRNWEALYHKTIPVIEEKYSLFSHLDLPILVVKNLEEFLNFPNKKKLEIYYDIINKPCEKIYAQWWINYICSK